MYYRLYYGAIALSANRFIIFLKLNRNYGQLQKIVLDQSYFNNGGNALHHVAFHQNAKGFSAFLNELDSRVLQQAVLQQDNAQWNVVHMAARYQNDVGFNAIVEKLNTSTLQQAALQQDNAQWNVLHMAARYQNDVGFNAIVEKISTSTLQQAALQQNNAQWNFLHMAAWSQNYIGFSAIVKRLNRSTLQQAALQQNDTHLNVLQIVALCQNAAGLRAIVKKLNTLTFQQAVLQQDNNHWDVVHIVAVYRDIEGLKIILDNIHPDTLYQYILNHNTPLAFQNIKNLNFKFLVESVINKVYRLNISHALSILLNNSNDEIKKNIIIRAIAKQFLLDPTFLAFDAGKNVKKILQACCLGKSSFVKGLEDYYVEQSLGPGQPFMLIKELIDYCRDNLIISSIVNTENTTFSFFNQTTDGLQQLETLKDRNDVLHSIHRKYSIENQAEKYVSEMMNSFTTLN